MEADADPRPDSGSANGSHFRGWIGVGRRDEDSDNSASFLADSDCLQIGVGSGGASIDPSPCEVCVPISSDHLMVG